MGTVAHKLGLRCFLDGIEIPIIEASVSSTEGQGASVSIGIVPTDVGYDIPPRSMVDLFYWDSDSVDVRMDGEVHSLGPQDPRHWRLLFHGEVVSVGYSKTESSRSMVLQCADSLTYLDSVQQHFFNFSSGGVESFERAFLGVDRTKQKFYDITTKGEMSNLYIWLTQSKFEGKPSLPLGVQRVLREMFFSVNDFYAKAFNRHRMGDLFVGVPGDRTSARLFQLQFVEAFIKSQVSDQGTIVTARALLNQLLGMVYHNYTTILAPPLDWAGRARGIRNDTPGLPAAMQKFPFYADASLNYHVIKPDMWFLDPPSCNVIFPDQYTSISYNRDYLGEPTRLFLRSELFFTGRDSWLTERFFAPDEDSLSTLLRPGGGGFAHAHKMLLDHERFVGINPSFHWEKDLSVYVKKVDRREFLSFVADYSFWRSRFAARTLTCQMPFNPNILVGYPCLILDRAAAPGQAARHFMGNVAMVTHHISQAGATTSITLNGARTHEEGSSVGPQNRTIEQVVRKGAGGWMDEKYDIDRIGEEVYKPLFGVRAFVDIAPDEMETPDGITGVVTAPDVATLRTERGREIASVFTLQEAYRLARENQTTQSLIQAFSRRPKANLVELFGISALGPADAAWSEHLRGLGYTDSGFFSASIDPDVARSAQHTFSVPVKVTREVQYEEQVREERIVGRAPSAREVQATAAAGRNISLMESIGGKPVYTVYRTIKVPKPSTSVVSKTVAFDTSADVQERQEAIRRYVASTETRGLRG